MTHYKCILLVIASNNTEYYKNARRIWKKYMNINPDIKVFFVYEELSTPLEDSDESDIIYNDIAIQPNSILNKTLRAMYAIGLLRLELKSCKFHNETTNFIFS